MDKEVTVSLTFSRRPDGGLRIHSDTLPGLALSSLNVPGALADLGPAIQGLLESEGRWPLDEKPPASLGRSRW